jgi:hypothetical protein
MFQLIEPYKKRPIRFLELWEEGEWKLKVYGITYREPAPRQALIEAGKAVVRHHLAQVPSSIQVYKVGFLGVHDARGANLVYLDYWADENELRHHAYLSPTDQPAFFQYSTPTGLIASTWDIYLINFERQAWVECVLTNPDGPDIEKYLTYRLDEEV